MGTTVGVSDRVGYSSAAVTFYPAGMCT